MRLVVVPPVPALLPAYASVVDPVADLRRACREAVAWLVDERPAQVVVIGDDAGGTSYPRRVAEWLLDDVGYDGELVAGPEAAGDAVLVLANGSARRGEKAPGHLDPRAFAWDDAVEAALRDGRADRLAEVDVELGRQLLASGASALRGIAGLSVRQATMDHAEDPFGVRYWVVRWLCES
jgi:hypothetical protein